MPKKEIAVKNSIILSVYLLLVWGFYRMLFRLPGEIEELLIKPLFWLVPVYILLKKEKLGLGSVGVTFKNLFPAIYFSIGLGIFFALEGIIVNYFKYKGNDFSANIGSDPFIFALLVSFATAVSEEVAFRGYIFNRLWFALKNEWSANLITSFVWALIHLPIGIFWWEYNFGQNLGFLILTTIFGIGSAFVFARTKNVLSSILLHVMWEWPIILFR
jgi:membrane protease YdiL (CAAX protease family)